MTEPKPPEASSGTSLATAALAGAVAVGAAGVRRASRRGAQAMRLWLMGDLSRCQRHHGLVTVIMSS